MLVQIIPSKQNLARPIALEIVELAIDTKTDTKTRDDFEFFFCRTDNGALSPPQTETQ